MSVPAWFACGVYRAQEAVLRRPTFSYFSELERSQWFPRVDLETLQARKLNRLLQAALEHSPWHAKRIDDAGLTERVKEGAMRLEELPRLPTMNKADARHNVDEIVWRGVPGGAFRYNTGGSSGEPLIFYYGRERQAADAAGRMRARRWWGVEFGEREAFLWGSPVELGKTDRIKMFRDRLVNQLVLNAFVMSPSRMDGYLEALRDFRPHALYGYASSVALLAAHAEAGNKQLNLPNLKAVFTTGEPLYPHQRELIARVFGVPVANEFGSRDSGFIAHEAPNGKMLLTSESGILEVLDDSGNAVAPGESGEAVITGLASLAQPFIRYRTGDVVTLAREQDTEGRGLHVIGEISGRQTDFVVREDGVLMHALAVIYVLRAVEGVQQFKCIQHTPLRMEVLVVPGEGWGEAAHAAVVAGLIARLGPRVAIEVHEVAEISPEVSGKHRYVVSHVPIASALEQAVP